MFDCVMPTRNARNGQLFTSQGRLNIKNARYAEDDRPARSASAAATPAARHSRAYLRHLYMAGEMSAAALNTLHNLTFYLDTMRRIRDAIAFRTFETFRQEFLRSALPPGTRFMNLSAAGQWMQDAAFPFLVAMGAPPQGGAEPVGAVHAVRAGPGHLLLRDPAADEAQAAEGAGVSRRLKVGDRVVTSGGIYGSITRRDRAVACSSRSPKGPHRGVAGRDRRLPGPGARRRPKAASHEQEPRWKVSILILVRGRRCRSGRFYPAGAEVNLGLDLKGGVHLVLRVQTDDALRLETETTVERLRDTLTRGSVQFTKLEATDPKTFVVEGIQNDAGLPRRRRSMPTRSSTARRAPAATPTR